MERYFKNKVLFIVICKCASKYTGPLYMEIDTQINLRLLVFQVSSNVQEGSL